MEQHRTEKVVIDKYLKASNKTELKVAFSKFIDELPDFEIASFLFIRGIISIRTTIIEIND